MFVSMGKIISKDSKYYYSGYDGIWNKDEQEYLIDSVRSYDKYRVFKSRGKYGVCDLEYNIIADPDYTYTYNHGKSSLNYKIELNDATHKTYYIYGTINIEGVAHQDLKLYSPSSSMIGMEYTYIVPNDFVFVAHLFDYYYLFQRKGGLYGILRYGWNLKAEILHNMHYTYFNNFIFDDPYKLRICLFNTNPDNQIMHVWKDLSVFVYSEESRRGFFINDNSPAWHKYYIDNWLANAQRKHNNPAPDDNKKICYNHYEDTSDRDIWNAMTDGMDGDYPDEGYDGDYEFMGR
jgi:hypothetical protein